MPLFSDVYLVKLVTRCNFFQINNNNNDCFKFLSIVSYIGSAEKLPPGNAKVVVGNNNIRPRHPFFDCIHYVTRNIYYIDYISVTDAVHFLISL